MRRGWKQSHAMDVDSTGRRDLYSTRGVEMDACQRKKQRCATKPHANAWKQNEERNLKCRKTISRSDPKRRALPVAAKACEKVPVTHMQMESHALPAMNLRLVLPSTRVWREERPSTTKRVRGKSCTCLCNCRSPMGSLDLGSTLATITSRELLWVTNQ